MRRSLASSLFAIVVARGAIAHAAEAGADGDSGFVFSGSLGIGYGSGAYGLASEQVTSAGERRDLAWRARLGGIAYRASAFGGYAMTRRFALGLGLDANIVPGLDAPLRPVEPQSGSFSTTIRGAMMASASLVAAFRPEIQGLQARLGVGWATAGFIYEMSGPAFDAFPSASTELVDLEAVAGPIASLSFGYSPRWLGVALVASAASLTSERSSYRPLTCTLEATASSF